MKKILLSLFLLLGLTTFAIAAEKEQDLIQEKENPHNLIYNDDKIIYSRLHSIWVNETQGDEDEIIFIKKHIEGAGSHSIYSHEDNSLAFALATDCELINNGKLIIVDNNILKYYKLEYNEGNFEQIELTQEEIQEVFPEAEIFKLSQIESDNKIWLHKPFRKNRTLILVNDTDKFFHGITCKSKNIQDSEIKGLITISRYGIIRFSHYGKYNGKLTFYIR